MRRVFVVMSLAAALSGCSVLVPLTDAQAAACKTFRAIPRDAPQLEWAYAYMELEKAGREAKNCPL